MHRPLHAAGLWPALLLLAAGVLAGCGDSPSTPQGPVVATVGVEPSTATLNVPRTLQLTATARDGSGAPVTGKAVTWHSDNQAVATVTPAGSVSALTPGTARITATVDGKAGTSTVTVQLAPVASVVVSPAAQTLGLGGSIQLNATLADAEGNTLTGRTVTWSSAAAAVASVDGNGLVRAHTAGSAVITAAAEGVTGTAQIVVTSQAAVVITSVSPATLQEGQTATITGTGFSAEAGQNSVLIDDAPATIVSASATSLTVTVPQGACLPARNVAVRVTTHGSTDAKSHPWRPAAFFDVAPGQQVRLTAAQAACLQFAASSDDQRFVVGIHSVSQVATQLTPFVVRGATPSSVAGGAATSLAGAATLHDHDREQGRVAIAETRAQRLLRMHRDDEADFRRQERQLLQRQFSRAGIAASTLSNAVNAAAAGVPGNVVVGDSITVRFPQRANSCTQSTPVRTVVRYNGTRSIWLEDVENPEGGFTASDFNALGEQFDGYIYEANQDYFGQPTDLDGNGKIVIVVTKEINKEKTTLGRVFFSDIFPEDCPAANGGEYFYGITPDSAGALGMKFNVAEAREYYPVIIAHELSHVIQVGRRRFTPGATAFQTIWELEGQATLAEEIVGHRVTGNRPGQNYGFSVAWNDPKLTPADWYLSWVIDLIYYFGFQSTSSTIAGAPEQCGWLAVPEDGNMGPCMGDRNLYGVTWSFLRWLSDHYGPTFPGGEQGLHRAMIEDRRTGFATIEGLIGRPIDELLAQWSAALYLDDRHAGVDPKLSFTSWNFHGGTGQSGAARVGIWANLIQTAQLRPRERPFGGFTEDGGIRSGSTAYLTLSGGRPATAVSIASPAGGALPSHMRVWVVRVQ